MTKYICVYEYEDNALFFEEEIFDSLEKAKSYAYKNTTDLDGPAGKIYLIPLREEIEGTFQKNFASKAYGESIGGAADTEKIGQASLNTLLVLNKIFSKENIEFVTKGYVCIRNNSSMLSFDSKIFNSFDEAKKYAENKVQKGDLSEEILIVPLNKISRSSFLAYTREFHVWDTNVKNSAKNKFFKENGSQESDAISIKKQCEGYVCICDGKEVVSFAPTTFDSLLEAQKYANEEIKKIRNENSMKILIVPLNSITKETFDSKYKNKSEKGGAVGEVFKNKFLKENDSKDVLYVRKVPTLAALASRSLGRQGLFPETAVPEEIKEAVKDRLEERLKNRHPKNS